ncbi:MAG TPA: glycosyltransferase [Xanthobacteraceae bacterium]|nr:glycosyltransferase [Xanthobacteraceae bacterium]
MSTSTPAISVLMPVYNAGRFLAPAVDSILAQTFSDFELIALDGGSHDGSVAWLRAAAARDARVIVVEERRSGLIESLNRGLAMARAPLIARMDADDVARPDRFIKQLTYLQEHPEVAVLGSAIDLIDECGSHLRTDTFPNSPEAVASDLPYRTCVVHPAVMARTAVLRSVGGYRTSARHAEDYDLWLRIAEVSGIANLPDALVSYRMHGVKASTTHLVAVELAALAVRGAARLRRSGRPDPLAAADLALPLRYRPTQQMFAGVMPRPEFALSFFRAVLGRGTEFGSLSGWWRLYLRHGLSDLDGEGAATMILLLGHNLLRRWRAGARMHAVTWYPFWALVTAMRHPGALWRLGRSAPQWLGLARARLEQTRLV